LHATNKLKAFEEDGKAIHGINKELNETMGRCFMELNEIMGSCAESCNLTIKERKNER